MIFFGDELFNLGGECDIGEVESAILMIICIIMIVVTEYLLCIHLELFVKLEGVHIIPLDIDRIYI